MTGGHWNRQGRRSGGYRKTIIPVPTAPVDNTVYRECLVCSKVVPPFDEQCCGCRAIRKLKEDGKIE